MKFSQVFGKKAFAGFLSLCIVLSSFGTAVAATNATDTTQKSIASDIKGHWAETVLKSWAEKGYIKGSKDGSLKPDNKTTRAEFASFVNRANSFTEQAEINFKDVSAMDWFYADVAKAKAAGYISGYQDQTFKPKKTITRLETAIIIAKLQKLGSSNKADKLSDTADLSAQSRSAIGSVIDAGYMSAGNGKFRPQDSLTRAEAVTVIDRAVAKPQFAKTYDKAGEYGSKDASETIKGSATITVPGVTLNNIVIEGDLVLAAGIGEGDVFLKNVTVKGKTIINGGGKNSIHITDSVLLTVIVDKKDGSIRIVAEGSTTVEQITLQSGARLEESQLTGSGFGDLVLSQAIPANAEVSLSGRFETVDVIATSLQINLEEGAIAELLVGQSAANTNLNVGSGANIVALILNALTNVSGQGSIGTATINANGSTIAQRPGNVVVGSGVNATVNGQTATNTSTSSGSNSGSPGTTDPGTTNPGTTVYGFSGTIIDADDRPVAGVVIKFRRGLGNVTGEVVATAETNAQGKYSVAVSPGVYYGEVVKAGYLKTYVVGVSLSAGGYNTGQNATIVTIPQAEEIRIVLSWGENPRDEDSHLLGPSVDGSTFHTWYSDKEHTVDGVKYADLDIDDVESYGPETTTIRQRVNGDYQFYVHHFSGISTLRKSGAKVEVYVGSATTPTKSYVIPTGEGAEIYWDVFQMNIDGANVTFTDRNVMTNTAPTITNTNISRQPLADEVTYENNYGANDVLTVTNLSVTDVVYYYKADGTSYFTVPVTPGSDGIIISEEDFGVNGSTIKVAVKSVGKALSSRLSVPIVSEAAYAAAQANKFVDFTIPGETSVSDSVYLNTDDGVLGSMTDFRITNLQSVTVTGATYLEIDGASNNQWLKLVAYNTSGSSLEYEATIEVTVGGHNPQTKIVTITVPTVEAALQDAVYYAEGYLHPVPGTALSGQIQAARTVLNNPGATNQDYIDALTALSQAIKAATPQG
ncbi:S-layer homology domain-containing protein [Cohnella cholangitidis]|uniref:S-layer protein n=1 Tax=Cohnella cholangitidis TaxID=2598458 RepID=A0A7G5BYT6_9BACL|nr:S-layer homology domain-containing protein [Cohnella cholangitidis]QMV42120.1 S-layer protein [Cohnella cholangitidis]